MTKLEVQVELKLVDDDKAVLRWQVLTYFTRYAPTMDRAKTLRQCALWLKYVHYYPINPDKDLRPIRDAVRTMRRDQGELILSMGGVGHWIAENDAQVRESTNRELRAKALDLMVTARKMRQSSIHRFGGQRTL